MEQFGIYHAFLAAGLCNKVLLLLLLIMSICSWAIVFSKYLMFRKHLATLKEMNSLAEKNTIKLQTYLEKNKKNVYAEGLNLVISHPKETKKDQEDLTIKVELATKIIGVSLGKDISKLATIANTAPFVGLLGTVLGVVNSFNQIGLTASASLAVIAPGIAEALYATAFGLFVAIPASVFYNLLTNKLQECEDKQDFLFTKVAYLENKE